MQNEVEVKGAVTKRVVSAKSKHPRLIYALTQWTVERRGRGWYIATTRDQFSGSDGWRGAYCSIESACLAISKRLAKEARQRHRRQSAFYGVEDDGR